MTPSLSYFTYRKTYHFPENKFLNDLHIPSKKWTTQSVYPRTTLFFYKPQTPAQDNDLYLQKILFAFITCN